MTMLAALLSLAISAVPNQGKAMQKLSKYMDSRLAVEKTPAEMEKIDAQIKKEWEKPLAVMITDMSGFTQLTKEKGILGFLMEIRRLQRLAEPVIKKDGGSWVKADADDLFVTHPSAIGMFQLAKDLLAAVAQSNQETGNTMGLAIGLGYGPTLLIGDEDMWGDSVNTSSKLGEDTAKGGEILVSEAFFAKLSEEKKAKNEPAPTCDRFEAGTRDTKFPFYQCH